MFPWVIIFTVFVEAPLVEHSNSGKKNFDLIRFGNLINLPLVH